MKIEEKSSLKQLIKSQKTNSPLEQRFYMDPTIFNLDMETFFFNQWIIVGHESRIPEKGNYFLFNIENESIIIIRDDNSKVNCFYNVCRHRGSKICLENEGSTKNLVCPYHAWSYKLDGSLKSARLMDEDFCSDEWSLHKCNSIIFEGLIFINFSNKPDNFNEFIKPVKPFIELHGLGEAKIAVRRKYPTMGNWKLTLDNFHECYHCQPSHPEYCEVHSSDYIKAYGAGSNTGPLSSEFMKELLKWNKYAEKIGHHIGEYTESKFSNFFRSAERTPFSKGKLSETKSGKPASTIMGKFKEFDGGYTTIGTSPFNSLLMSNDFATIFTFIPKGPLETEVELMWLVHKDAKKGVDYNVDKMTWMWHETTLADKKIIENNQNGVMSKKYIPGPLSQMEVGLEKLKSWYLNHLEMTLGS